MRELPAGEFSVWGHAARVGCRRSGGRENCARLGIALQPAQVGAHFGGTLITEFAIFFEQLVKHLLETRGYIGVEPDGWRRRPVQDGVEDYSGGVSAKRNRAGCHFVEDRTEGEQVAARVEFLATGLLGRHICHRADGGSWAGQERLVPSPRWTAND